MNYQNILISGASSGMGAALVRQYAKQAKTLGLIALAGDELTDIKQQAERLGAKQVFAYPADVSNREAARAAVADFAQKAGSIDLWIAGAAVDIDVPLTHFDESGTQKIEAMYAVNVNGFIYSTNAVLEQMLSQQPKGFFKKWSKPKSAGHIVGMASLAGKKIYPTHADYSATKTAVDAYLESLRVRLIGHPITVTTVSPGFVRTPMTANHTHPMPFMVSAETAVENIIKGIEQGKEQIAFPQSLVLATNAVRMLPPPIWKMVARLVKHL